MRESKPHGFVAWLFDFYVVSFLLGAVVATGLAVLRTKGNTRIALTVLGTAFLVSLAYHLAIVRHTTWLSPGERIAGRFSDASGKTWRNPYRRSRWPLFAMMLVVTILAGNSRDGIGRGDELPLGTVALDAVALLILVIGLAVVGRGNAWGMLAPAGYAGLLAVTAIHTTSPDVSTSISRGLAIFFAVCALLCTGIGAWYASLRQPAAARVEI